MLIQDITPRTGLDRAFYPVMESLDKLTILTDKKRTIYVKTREITTNCMYCQQATEPAEYPVCDACQAKGEQENE